MDRIPLIWQGQKVAATMGAFNQAVHDHYRKTHGKNVHLGVIWVGDHKASHTYVRAKEKAARALGMDFTCWSFPADTSVAQVMDGLFQARSLCHGILVQMPVPIGHDATAYLVQVPLVQDVDGLNPTAPCLGAELRPFLGDAVPRHDETCRTRQVLDDVESFQRWWAAGTAPLAQGAHPWMIPCTPLGCLGLFSAYKMELQGKHCVVVGCSSLVGWPLAHLLVLRRATVTVAHEWTSDLAKVTRQGEIICVATGVRHLIRPEHVQEGAVVIDVGIHQDADGLTGDVDPSCYDQLAAYTPVPGGVGPLTVQALMWNTLVAAWGQKGIAITPRLILDSLWGCGHLS